jgi:DNA-binding transcriptional regulator YbjK
VSTNRERALETAVQLLGTEGLRALTHARIDERAGLPKGSTSNYFRTRAALLNGVVEAMVRRETPAMGAALEASTPPEFVDALVRVYAFLVGPNRVMTTARMVLFVEASHDPDLREALRAGRSTFADLLRPVLERLGAANPATAMDAIVVCFEGLFMHHIARHSEVDARAVIEIFVRGLFGRQTSPQALGRSRTTRKRIGDATSQSAPSA